MNNAADQLHIVLIRRVDYFPYLPSSFISPLQLTAILPKQSISPVVLVLYYPSPFRPGQPVLCVLNPASAGP